MVRRGRPSANGDRARSCDDDGLREVRARSTAPGRPVNLVEGGGEGEGAADSLVGPGSRAGHDRYRPADTRRTRAGIGVDGEISDRGELLVEIGDIQAK